MVERRRNRAAGFPAYVPPNARGATNKRGPKPAGMSAREISEVVGTLGVHPGLEEGARREPREPQQNPTEEEEVRGTNKHGLPVMRFLYSVPIAKAWNHLRVP